MLLKKLAGETLIYGGGDLVGKLIAFFTFPIIAAALSPRAFGTLDLIMTTIGLAGLLMNCGLNNAVQRFYWDEGIEKSAQRLIVSSGLYTQIVFGIVLAVAAVISIPFIINWTARFDLPFTSLALFAAVTILLVTQITQYILDVIRLHFAPLKFLVFSLFGRVLTAFAAVFVVIVLHAGIDGLLLVQALVGLAVIPLGIYMVRKDIVWTIDRAWSKKLVQYGYPFIFAGLAYWLFGSMDRWMLASMHSVEEAGIYSVSFRFATLVLFVSAAFGQAWSPYAIKIKTDHPKRYKKLYADILLLILYCMLIVGGFISLFSGEIIAFFMPGEYEGSAIPLSILSFAIILQATQQVTAIGISLAQKTYLFARLAWAAALLNFAANYLLIPYFGAAGAAVATLLAYFFLTTGYVLYSQKLHPLPISWWRVLFLITLGSCVLAVSIIWNVNEIDWMMIAAKLSFALTCLILGLCVLPLKGFRNVRAI